MVRSALAFSGATTEETKFIQEDAAAGKYIDLNANWSYAGAAYFRVTQDDAGNPRVAPYNEYTTSNLLREATNRAGGGAAVTLPYQHQNEVHYAYDGPSRTYARYQYDP